MIKEFNNNDKELKLLGIDKIIDITPSLSDEDINEIKVMADIRKTPLHIFNIDEKYLTERVLAIASLVSVELFALLTLGKLNSSTKTALNIDGKLNQKYFDYLFRNKQFLNKLINKDVQGVFSYIYQEKVTIDFPTIPNEYKNRAYWERFVLIDSITLPVILDSIPNDKFDVNLIKAILHKHVIKSIQGKNSLNLQNLTTLIKRINSLDNKMNLFQSAGLTKMFDMVHGSNINDTVSDYAIKEFFEVLETTRIELSDLASLLYKLSSLNKYIEEYSESVLKNVVFNHNLSRIMHLHSFLYANAEGKYLTNIIVREIIESGKPLDSNLKDFLCQYIRNKPCMDNYVLYRLEFHNKCQMFVTNVFNSRFKFLYENLNDEQLADLVEYNFLNFYMVKLEPKSIENVEVDMSKVYKILKKQGVQNQFTSYIQKHKWFLQEAVNKGLLSYQTIINMIEDNNVEFLSYCTNNLVDILRTCDNDEQKENFLINLLYQNNHHELAIIQVDRLIKRSHDSIFGIERCSKIEKEKMIDVIFSEVTRMLNY